MQRDSDVTSDALTATGGESGAVGYEYQIEATVWLALDLMLYRRLCPSIEVEPVSQEDLAANLDVTPENASLDLRLDTGPVELEIQIKTHGTGHWTASNFREVVEPKESPLQTPAKEPRARRAGTSPVNPAANKPGPPPRPRPLARLRERPERQYLFVTDADVDGPLLPFVVAVAGARSGATRKPWNTAPDLPADLAARIGIRRQISFEFLELSIHRLLGERGHVPWQHRAACRRELVQAIRDRLLNRVDKTFTLEDLRAIVRRHHGLRPEREPMVQPRNFAQMHQCLIQTGALLLAGPPGTGKTTVAEELTGLLGQGDDASEVVQVTDDPAQIRQRWDEDGQILFVVDDPWGEYRVNNRAERWWKEMPRLLAGLRQRPGKRIVVTTRTSIYAAVQGRETPAELQEAMITLQAGDYTKAQRREILHRALAGSQPWQREWLGRHEEVILKALQEPMALHAAGRTIIKAKNIHGLDVDKLIRTCAQDALGSEFAREVAGRGETTGCGRRWRCGRGNVSMAGWRKGRPVNCWAPCGRED